MPLILGTNSIKDTGYNVANSLRFDDGSSDFLSKTFSSYDSTKKFTISVWLKKSANGVHNSIYGKDGATDSASQFYFDSSNEHLRFYDSTSSSAMDLATNRLFKDNSAWYNIILAVDTTQGTASNRVKIYVNGTQETSFATETYPAQDSTLKALDSSKDTFIGVGEITNGNKFGYFNGYMAEYVFIDGSQLTPSSFGEFDSDSPTIWKPINVSGLTFGTNGFYLDFENSGSLGADVSGNSNNFTVNNLTSVDQSTDTCTNNFCTWNPLANYDDGVAFSEGNLVAMSGTNDQWDGGRATMGFSQGKWYFECLFVAGVSTQYIGVQDESAGFTGSSPHNQNGTTVFYNNSGGEIRKDGSATTNDYGTFSSSEVAGIAIDADNFTISVYKGGSAIVNAYALSTTRTGFLFPFTTNMMNGDGVKVNFGSPPYSESGGNSDANGYGNFNQSVPSGYFAINTKNLAEYG